MAKGIRLKAENRKANADKRPYAKARFVRMSPSKINIVLDQIRGKKAVMACAILENMPDSAAAEALKVLNSAIANAENNKGMNKDTLVVAQCYTGQGPLLKRVNFRGRGRVDRIQKKSAHITIVLDETVGG